MFSLVPRYHGLRGSQKLALTNVPHSTRSKTSEMMRVLPLGKLID